MMTVLIIDDEPSARNLIETILKKKYDNSINILQANRLKTGVSLIKEHKPSIVYLDIKMPDESGIKILDYFENEDIDFKIIFTTAYGEFAIEAFKLFAIDFLLKPINPKELLDATAYALKKKEKEKLALRLNKLEQHMRELSTDKIMLQVPKGYIFVNHKDIMYFEADGMSTKVNLVSGKQEIIAKPLRFFADQLEGNLYFYRPHRSYLINLKFIAEIKRGDGFYIIMENRRIVHISRDKKEEFLAIINSMYNK